MTAYNERAIWKEGYAVDRESAMEFLNFRIFVSKYKMHRRIWHGLALHSVVTIEFSLDVINSTSTSEVPYTVFLHSLDFVIQIILRVKLNLKIWLH